MSEKKGWTAKKKRRRLLRNKSDPTRADIDKAISDFLRDGGRIKKIEPTDISEINIEQIPRNDIAGDEFLMGV